MVGALRADKAAAAAPESPIREGSPPPHTPPHPPPPTSHTLKPTFPFFPSSSSQAEPVEMRQVSSVHLAQDLISRPTLMGKLHPPAQQRVAAGWRRRVLGGATSSTSSSGASVSPPSLPPAAVWSLPCHQLLPLPPT